MKKQPVILTSLLSILLICYSSSSYAYLDPGTGSIILQGVIAAVAGAVVTLRLYWYRIKSFFSKSSKKPEKSTSVDASSEEDSNL